MKTTHANLQCGALMDEKHSTYKILKNISGCYWIKGLPILSANNWTICKYYAWWKTCYWYIRKHKETILWKCDNAITVDRDHWKRSWIW